VTLSVINRLANAIAKLNAITKICKYRRLHEGHHLILMAMEVHGTPKPDMECFIKEGAHLFHSKQSRGHLSFFCIQFFFDVLVLLFSVLILLFDML
jgi:hypothetical protein